MSTAKRSRDAKSSQRTDPSYQSEDIGDTPFVEAVRAKPPWNKEDVGDVRLPAVEQLQLYSRELERLRASYDFRTAVGLPLRSVGSEAQGYGDRRPTPQTSSDRMMKDITEMKYSPKRPRNERHDRAHPPADSNSRTASSEPAKIAAKGTPRRVTFSTLREGDSLHVYEVDETTLDIWLFECEAVGASKNYREQATLDRRLTAAISAALNIRHPRLRR